MRLTVKQAAKAGWASRPTLYRAIKEGRISFEKNEAGHPVIDPAELVRVFGEPRKAESQDKSQESNLAHLKIHEIQLENAVLKEKLAALERERDGLADRERKAEEREKWLRGQLDQAQRLIAPPAGSVGFWQRLFGGRKP